MTQHVLGYANRGSRLLAHRRHCIKGLPFSVRQRGVYVISQSGSPAAKR